MEKPQPMDRDGDGKMVQANCCGPDHRIDDGNHSQRAPVSVTLSWVWPTKRSRHVTKCEPTPRRNPLPVAVTPFLHTEQATSKEIIAQLVRKLRAVRTCDLEKCFPA